MAGSQLISQAQSIYESRPQRVILVSNPGLTNEEVFPVLLNPTRLRETINVEWSRLPVIGLDHEVPHYSRTKSIEIPFNFLFSAFEAGRQLKNGAVNFDANNELVNLTSVIPTTKIFQLSMDFANFLRSLCFPTRTGLRPPTVKVIWPNVLSLLGVVSSLTLEYIKMDQSMAPLYYSAEVTFLETRLTRRYSEDVRRFGLLSDRDDKAVGDFTTSKISRG